MKAALVLCGGGAVVQWKVCLGINATVEVNLSIKKSVIHLE
jgi:hypothetical protein